MVRIFRTRTRDRAVILPDDATPKPYEIFGKHSRKFVPVVVSLHRANAPATTSRRLKTRDTLPAVSLPSLAMLGRALPIRALLVLCFGTFVFGLFAAAAAVALGFS
jgi:hypothetical protein